MNNCVIIGRITKDLELNKTQSNISYVRFTFMMRIYMNARINGILMMPIKGGYHESSCNGGHFKPQEYQSLYI